jgi:SAM-dependent methyltransferase
MEMDTTEGATYAEVVGHLGTLYAGAAQDLAAALRVGGYVPPGAAVLDVGAGSGIWSFAVVGPDPKATVTALDRERVLEMTQAHASAAGLAERLLTIPGDWREAPLPEEAYDVAILANICHLEPGPDVARLLQRVSSTLRPGGALLIVDTIPDRRADADPGPLLQGLQLGLRSRGGGIHDREAYASWLEQAGLDLAGTIPLSTATGTLTALLARAPTT